MSHAARAHGITSWTVARPDWALRSVIDSEVATALHLIRKVEPCITPIMKFTAVLTHLLASKTRTHGLRSFASAEHVIQLGSAVELLDGLGRCAAGPTSHHVPLRHIKLILILRFVRIELGLIVVGAT